MPSAAAAAKSAAIDALNERFAIISLVVLLGILAIYVLAFLPRAIARYSTGSAWKDGWMLMHSPVPTTTRPTAVRRPTVKRQIGAPQQLQRSVSQLERIAHFNRQKSRLAPVHYPSWTTILSPFSHTLTGRFAGYSIAQCLVLAGYAVLIGITMLLLSNPVTNAQRKYCISQIDAAPKSIVQALAGSHFRSFL